MTSKWIRLFAGAAAGVTSGTALATSRYMLQEPQTVIAREIYDLHTLIMWIIVGIFVVVFGTMTYAIVRHRKSVGHRAEQFHENTTIEIVWTIVPFLILVGMAYPATRTVLAMKDTTAPDLTIKVTGYQWKWGYEYLNEGVSFFSALATPRDQIENRAPKGEHYLLEVDNPLVVPVGKKVRVLVTANDVIHAWWVPAFGVKQDAIPGFVRDTWFTVKNPGTYRGQCAELCGKDHGFMPIVVEAVSPERFAQWIAEQKKRVAPAAPEAPKQQWALAELKAHGEKIYAGNCVACHQANGMGVPGAFPALSGSKIATGPKEEQIRILLEGVVKDGKPTAMVSFRHLSDVDLAAVITYTRNSWANKIGDAVAPADVKAQRKR